MKPWAFWAPKLKTATPLSLEDLKAELQKTQVCARCRLTVVKNGVIEYGDPHRIFHRECVARDG